MNRKRGWTAVANWLRRRIGGTAGEAPPTPATQRRPEPVAAGVPGKIVIPSSGREGECVVTNISPAGAEIACEIEELLDTPIVLYAAGLGRFEGHVIWQRNGSYGVKFNPADAGETRAAQEPVADRRRHTRVASNVAAQFTREDGTVVPCVVLDFSVSGVSLKANVRPRIGEHILIGGMIGKVVRYHEAGVGIEFVERDRDEARYKTALESLDRWRSGAEGNKNESG